MRSIKIISASSLIFFSLTAYAGLTTYNYTNEDSSVKVTSGGGDDPHPCSMDAGVYTPKQNPNGTPGTSSASNVQIGILCSTKAKINPCEADIYNTNSCTGEIIGHAKLDLTTKSVTEITTSPSNQRYRFVVNNNGTVLEIRYIK